MSHTVGGEAGEQTLLVTFVAGVASPVRSTIEADPTENVADGASTSTITVTLLDAFDNPIGEGGDDATVTFTVNGADGAATATVEFTPTPQLSIGLSDDTVLQGATVIVHGLGFLPNEEVAGLIESTPLDLGTQNADSEGTATFTAQIPDDFNLGEHLVTLSGEESGDVSAVLTVIGTPSPAPSPTSSVHGPIPDTGASGAALVWLGGEQCFVTAIRAAEGCAITHGSAVLVV